jgi:HD-GYP domain-containing protein (c-di-GMP phosphodiesterase class II)
MTMSVHFDPNRTRAESNRLTSERLVMAHPATMGLTPLSQATRIANRFLVWYLVASIAWILGSDHLVALAEQFAKVPEWFHSAKGLGYVIVLGLVLRRATRTYIVGVERANAAYIEAKLELVRRLALAAEYRDDQTGGHNQRIGTYSAIVAKKLGMDPKVCETLSYAALLHDLGKIGVPDALLLKPGAFSPEERQAMECHTTLGAEILSGGFHPLVEMSHSIALTHHERWDGKGYPQGLAGHDIPIEGRIVAVCDVYDALTSKRPYKEAWSSEEAVAEIVRQSGSHFDPLVVDAFLMCRREIEAVRGSLEGCDVASDLKLSVAA